MTLGGKGALLAGLLAGMAMGLLGCSGEKFERNPNLRLLYRYIEGSFGRSCYYPQWASGNRVYFRLGNTTYWHAILSINEGGTGLDTLIIAGDSEAIYHFDLSPDSATMAVLTSDNVLIVSLDGVILDTMPRLEGSWYLKFNHDGTWLFVDGPRDSIYRIQVGDSVYETYVPIPPEITLLGFEVTSNDSIIFGTPERAWPRFCPGDSSLLVYWSLSDKWILEDLSSGEKFVLDTDPYEETLYEDPSCCFSPDGKALVFTAGEAWYSDGMFWTYNELWILEGVR